MIDTIRQKIQEVFGPYDRHVPAHVINRLFVAIPSDETTLTQEIIGYLLEHNYEALETPKGQSLREQLISTDWRQKEAKIWLAEPQQPVATLSGDVSVHPISTPFSQSNKVLIALVIVFVSILLWLWKGKLTEIDSGAGRDEVAELEQTRSSGAVQVKETIRQPNVGKAAKKVALLPTAAESVAKNSTPLLSPTETTQVPVAAASEPAEPATAVPTKPYDSVDSQVGDFGLRAARKGGKWGYVDQKDKWHIDPVYDDVTPFLNGKATVVLDGQQIVVDRDGGRIRDDN
ncbi:WG repeat-containing protein [Larkinella humicola]|uniref:WG repeat-containing protein n=1 Tax=Larkinella humicola TaxID=2607654 RepID=A0A5N1JKE6_9BACT|nr:WG repeat-containing protein [Larkinella humicola]KAA9354563.1 WG repeat-containing protein [Larkinella humicola]